MIGKNLCIIQARLGSIRLPRKILLKINNKPLIQYQIERVKKSKLVDKIVIATTINQIDDEIELFCKNIGISCFRGSEEDVLKRFHDCSLEFSGYDNFIRLTGDCPLVDPKIIDELILFFSENNFDYASNVEIETFPDGIDVEIFNRQSLIKAHKNAKLLSEREHVTLYFKNNSIFKKGNLLAPVNYGNIRLTVDNIEDFEVIKFIVNNSNSDDGYLKYVELLKRNPKIMGLNSHLGRNEGLIKSLANDN